MPSRGALTQLQVADPVRLNERLILRERTNLRLLKPTDLPEGSCPVDLVTLDLSFISIVKVTLLFQ